MIFRLAALTAILYVLLGFVIEATLYVIAYFAGGASISNTRGGWWFFFGLIWIAAFTIAWHFAPISVPSVRR
jgi:hypothetical protein